MKNPIALAVLTVATTFASIAQAQVAPPDRIRGPLPKPVALQVATCPAQFSAVLNQGKMTCERQVTHLSDVKCPSPFPTYVARNAPGRASDRDICVKSGVSVTSDQALANLLRDRDYVEVPVNGVRSGVSYVAADSSITEADGWHLNANYNSIGVVDRYERRVTLKATPILVNP